MHLTYLYAQGRPRRYALLRWRLQSAMLPRDDKRGWRAVGARGVAA